MRAAEIIGCDVFDQDGRPVGRVHDLRFNRTRSNVPGTDWYRLTGFECRTASLGHRLGYGRSAMNGPWILKALFRFSARHSVIVEWSDVVVFERPRIELRKPAQALRSAWSEGE